ncbi:hypothetical protein GGX14DRAFT_636747 [Mycena pura]|uniref:Uncharacterized protein n=1 Tax=Mycena pura TaxID=153505 RepID=A0AAD6VHI6_9AGAR|nr:hypothetical protein GGX14DRAFT_636747 [Mycena pura]
MLFTNPRTLKPLPARFAAATNTQTRSTPSGMGYLAFPPGQPPAHSGPQIFSAPDPAAQRERDEAERQQQSLDEAWAARRVRDEAARKQRLEAEAAEALKGEMDWVGSGGILRDARGERDYVRTEAIREELRVRAIERVLTARWEVYEARWADLSAKVGRDRAQPKNVRFTDVPWPACPSENSGRECVTVDDLTVDRVEEFLLGPLKVRGCAVTKKERIRSSLLRWHPDKATALLARVVDTDLEAVQEGIHLVVLSFVHGIHCTINNLRPITNYR